MDLSQLNLEQSAEQGADLILDHPVTGDKLDIVITLAGTDSAVYRRKQKEINARRMTKLSRGKKADLSISDDEACDMLAACTLGWKNVMLDNEAIKFSTDAAKQLYLDYHWIREQVDEFIGDRANFFKAS